jgi:hypothetical protein
VGAVAALAAWLRARTPRQWLAGALLVALVLALVVPYAAVLPTLQLPLAAAAGLVGFLARRRLADAAWLALPVLLFDEIEPGVGGALYLCVALPLLALSRRPRFSVLLAGALVALLALAIQVKQQFAGSALTWQDVQFFFRQFAANIGVAASQPTVVLYALAAALGVLGAAALGWRWDRPHAGATRAGRAWLTIAAVVPLTAWCGYDVFDDVLDAQRRGARAVAVSDRPLTRFFATAGLGPVWQLRGADASAFAQRAARRIGPAAASGGPPSDILVFLQESQFNPAVWADCPPGLCQLPAFGPGRHTRAHGPMQVHIFGGGTWLTEFAAATGVPHTMFGPAGDFAPFSVAPGVRHALPRSLKAAGYRTVALYPVPGAMMNARDAYRGYGFDAFYDSAQLGLSGTYETTDAQMHRAALRVLAEERRHGQPVYLFVVTIFNHSEHGVQMERVPAELVRHAAAAFADPREAQNVADFIWRTREFQQALDATSAALLPDPRPVVLAWFGDHLPAFGRVPGLHTRMRPAPAAAGRIPARHQTWYHVASNADHLPATAQAAPLDIVFLPGLLAQAAGVPLDPWLAANVTARQECEGLLLNCAHPAVRDAYLDHVYRNLGAFALP